MAKSFTYKVADSNQKPEERFEMNDNGPGSKGVAILSLTSQIIGSIHTTMDSTCKRMVFVEILMVKTTMHDEIRFSVT